MSRLLVYLDKIWFTYCIMTILPQVQRHTHLVHVNISMTQMSGTAESHTSAIYKIPSPAESLHINDLQWKLNSRNKFYNNISEEVLF